VNALVDAGNARGATAYVTLEPCAHHGRTPPCSQALIDAGVSRVIYAAPDPNPSVDGKGADALSAAGIDVHAGLMRDSADELNRAFLTRIRCGRPFVRLKLAASLDGATAMRDGESQWITGEAARLDVQRLRAESSAIMTGIGTILADDPSLNVRAPRFDTLGRYPLRVVVDSTLRTPPDSKLFELPGDVIVFCADDAEGSALANKGAEVISLPGQDARVDIDAMLAELGQREINLLLVEAGPRLAGSLLSAKTVDELVIYQAPHIMGSNTRRMLDTPAWQRLMDRQPLEFTDIRRVGRDLRITARPATQE
jgi:diaminohydroxyphosphoribosylaminopyrimidine deaminase/5-amino-6-(5-phosphoribosylamino)uracil reductase